MADHHAGSELSGLLLLKLHQEASVADIEQAPPLGTTDEVQQAIVEALPGTSFEQTRGHFVRDDYSIEFDLGGGDPVQTAVVTLHGHAAGIAVRRLLRKTQWRLFSPRRGAFIEPDELGGATGTTSPHESGILETRAEAPRRQWDAARASGARYARLLAGMAACLVLAIVVLWSRMSDPIAENEAAVVDELIFAGRANLGFRVSMGHYTSPEQLGDPAVAALLGASALPATYMQRVRHGYRFEVNGTPPDAPDTSAISFKPAFRSYVYIARPVEPGRTGVRTFAFYSDSTAVYARTDGQVPTEKDQLVRAIQ